MSVIGTIAVCLLLTTLSVNGVLSHWNHTILVSSNGSNSSSCWSGLSACRTLDYAVMGITQNSTRVLILDGRYNLNAAAEVTSRAEIAIVGEGMNNSHIECFPSTHTGPGLLFTNIDGLYLANLTLTNCGRLSYSTVQDESSPNTTLLFRSAVYVLNSTDVSVESVSFINGTGVGLSLFDVNGAVSILDSFFHGNAVPHSEEELYCGGGGLHIEHTYCTPGRTSNCSYESNPFVSNSHYEIQRCHFVDNRATTTHLNTFVQEKAESTRALGKGAGVSLDLMGSSKHNTFILSKCTFINNTACYGGGYNSQFHDCASNNFVTLSYCVFKNNTANGDGGAVRVGMQFYVNECMKDNHFSVLNTLFAANGAKWGGAIEFFSSRTTDIEQVTGNLNFTNCTWTGNYAMVAPAVDLAPEAWTTLSDGYLPVPVFQHCYFSENYLVQSDDHEQVSSSGTLFVNTYTTNFTFVTFRNNVGTALYLTAGSVNVLEGSTVIFDANEAIQGGAVQLMGFSAIRTFPNSVLIFTNNNATDVGGAIFASSIDATDFLYSRNCFIRYFDDTILPNQWKTAFEFSNNTAENYGHSIYATSLLPCARAAMPNDSDNMNVSHAFSLPWAPFNYSDPNKLYNIASDPSRLWLNLTDQASLRFAPGQPFDLKPVAVDDMNNTVNSTYKTSIHPASLPIRVDGSYLTNGVVRITGLANIPFRLTLQTTGFRKVAVSANVTLSTCPPGFVRLGTSSDEECVCSASTDKVYAGISQCDNEGFFALLDKGFWAGCSDSEEGSLVTAQCPLGYCREVHSHGDTIPLNVTCTELDEFLCGAKRRTGALCGQCQQNLSVHFHSQRYLCSECKYRYLGWLFYILSELLPLTILFLTIMVFNISLTSGNANAFILFAQVLDFFQVNSLGNFALPNGIAVVTDIYQFIFGFLNLDFFHLDSLSFCLWEGATVLDVLVIKYATAGYALILIITLVLAFRVCSCTQKIFKGSSIVHGISAFLIISYAQCAKVSFQILTRTELQGQRLRHVHEVVFLSGTTHFLSKDHLLYAFPAIFVLLTICTVPPVLLLAYPSANKLFTCCESESHQNLQLARSFRMVSRYCRIHRLKPFFDCFQGCFKDNFRFFAGLYFVYRLAISAVFAFTDNGTALYTYLEVVILFMLGLHAVLQPYKRRIHNIIDALLFTDMAAINAISLYNFYWSQYQSSHKKNIVEASTIQIGLIYIPVLYALIIISLKLASRFRCARVKLRGVNKYLPLFVEEEEYMQLQGEDLFDEEERLFEADELRSGSRAQRCLVYGSNRRYTT